MKKILLTGSTGFIGNAFLRSAILKGYEIGALILPGLKIPEDLKHHPSVRWFVGSLNNLDWDEIAKFKPDVCLHTAWITTPGLYLHSPENYIFAKESLLFIEKAVKCGVETVIVTGTCIEYKKSNEPLNEDRSPIEPDTIYARCKHQLHQDLIIKSQEFGFNLAWARIFYPYGVGEHQDRLCSYIIRKLLNNEKVELKTPNSAKDYIYITDIAEGLLLIIERDFSGTINIGSGQAITVKEIAYLIGELMNKRHLIEESKQSEQPDCTVADIAKLKSLGWNQKVSIQNGLKMLIEHFQVK
ncbi:MAG: NAD-dependent epimerase/dehydratase family protein [Verrucomicrobiia bacterium]